MSLVRKLREDMKDREAGKKDMGNVMGSLMPGVKGRADGKLVNVIVSRLLQ